MTPEQSLAATVKADWALNLKRAEAVFLDKTDEQLRQPVAPGKNRLVYLYGHLIAVSDAMLPLLGIGERLHPELDAAFLDGPDDPASPLLSAAELGRLWAEVHGALRAGLERFTPADWTARHTAMSDEDFAANPLRNRAAVVMNRAAHVAFHVGQCALAAK
jgi:hypothetical protein